MARLLLDTNVWLEMLLQQEHAAEARDLLQTVPLADVAITDFSIHSIGIILTNGGKDDDFGKFVTDVLQDTPFVEVRQGHSDLKKLLDVRARQRLDFDDAYQYVAAEKHNLTLVSFDTDFDRTERGRKTPAEVLEEPPVAHDKPATKPRRRKKQNATLAVRAGRALRRAARDARKTARFYGTPIYVWRDGKVVAEEP